MRATYAVLFVACLFLCGANNAAAKTTTSSCVDKQTEDGSLIGHFTELYQVKPSLTAPTSVKITTFGTDDTFVITYTFSKNGKAQNASQGVKEKGTYTTRKSGKKTILTVKFKGSQSSENDSFTFSSSQVKASFVIKIGQAGNVDTTKISCTGGIVKPM